MSDEERFQATASTDAARGSRWIVPVFFVALALLVAVAALAWRYLRAEAETAARVEHTHRVLVEVAAIGTAIATMEAQHRGALLTGDAALASQRDTSFALARSRLAALRGEVADNPAQQARLDQVDAALQRRHERMQAASRVAREQGMDAAHDYFRSGAPAQFRAAQVPLDAFQAEESALLARRTERLADRRTDLQLTLAAGTGLALSILAAGFLRLLRQARRSQRMRAALARSDALQKAMLDAAGFMIVATGPDGTITLCNRAACEALGYRAEELIGRETPARFYAPEALAAQAESVGAALGRRLEPGFEALVARAADAGLEVGEREWRARSGRTIPVQVAISAVHDSDGGLLGYIAIAVDLTERRRAEHQIQALNARLEARARELEASNRELESFSYSVSHDLRAPVRHVDGYAQMLIEDFDDRLGEDARRYLQAIRDAARRMGALIDDLLGLSRLGRKPLQREQVDMRLLAESALVDVLQDGGNGGRVGIGDLPPVPGDASLLKQVWINLLANAIKYSAPKGADARISVRGEQRDGACVYTVRDNGVGFDMRYADKLFGVFQRLHRADEFEGTGVGLATVHRIVTRHGGTIDVEAEPGRGACFRFRLPVEKGQP